MSSRPDAEVPMTRMKASTPLQNDPSWPDLDAHGRLVDELPARITAAVASGAMTAAEAERILAGAAEVLAARRSAHGADTRRAEPEPRDTRHRE